MFGLAASQFIGQNVHFAVNLFVALACFVGGWLYLDAWSERHHAIDLAKWLGFFILAIGFLLDGAVWGTDTKLTLISAILKVVGYASILLGNATDPIQPRPKNTGFAFDTLNTGPPPNMPAPQTKPADAKPVATPAAAATTPSIPAATAPKPTAPASSTPAAATTPAAPAAPSTATKPTSIPVTKTAPALIIAGTTLTLTTSLSLSLPILALAITILYWRRATVGLERHIRPLAYTFLIFTIGELLGLASLWRGTDNPLLQPIVDPLGPIWIAQHLILTLGAALLTRWVWRYLTKRLVTQLFLMMTSLTVVIVLIATVSITSLLLTNLQNDSLKSLETSAKVLGYAVDSKTAETRANAQILAQNPAVATAIVARDHAALATFTGDLLVSKHLSDVVTTDDAGQVLARASDPERVGDSLSDDTLVKRALTGATASSIATRSGVLAPSLILTTASPILQGTTVVGVSLASLALDNTFVDGIKHTTGLDSTVYAGNIRAATTLVGPDGTSRSIGAKETHTAVLTNTLNHGQIWHGLLDISNQSYLSIYLPLKDVDNTVVGMLFVGQPEDAILNTAQAAVRLTFASAALWLLIIMLPVYALSRQIVRQLR